MVWSCKSSRCWTTALIKKLWEVAWDMWDHCNKELHSESNANQHILHLAVNDWIVAAYSSSAQQLPQDALHFFQQLIAVVLQYPFESKQPFLESVQVVQQQHQHHKFGQYLSEQHLMARWLQSANKQNSTNPQPDWGRQLHGSCYIFRTSTC